MRTAFHLFSDFYGKESGSSRIRGNWVIKYWDGAESFIHGRGYDVEIFQKVYWINRAKKTPAIKILDICDTDWTSNDNVMPFIKHVDAITCPTEKFIDFFKDYTDVPVKVIPDRVDLETIPKPKEHKGTAKNVVWFGFHNNQEGLVAIENKLLEAGVKLTVISNDIKHPLPKLNNKGLFNYVKYDEKTADHDILKHADFVVMPPHPKDDNGDVYYKYSFKSNNKTVHSWALGLPVATSAEEFDRFMDPEERKKEAKKRLNEVKAKYDVRQSVYEYLELIKELA